MRLYPYIFWVIFLGVSPVWAGPSTRPTNRPSTQPVSVPFQLTDTNHILVRVKINGQGPFNFIMDTGAPAMFVRVPVGKKLGLKTGDHGMAMMDQLEIEGGARLNHVQCVVETPYQIEGMNAIGASGVDLDGLLGYSILARYRLQIDLSKDHMIWTPLNYVPPPLVSGRRQAGAAPERVDQDEENLESAGGLLKVLGPLIKPATLAPKYRGFLGLELSEKDNAVTVLRVLGNSPADKAGIDWSDQILSINNKSITTIAQAQLAMMNIRPGQPVTIALQRNLSQIKLKLTSAEGL